MAPGIPRRMLSLVAPEGLLLLGTVLLERGGLLDEALGGFSAYLAPVAFGAGALLAARFRHGRVLVALLLLALADLGLSLPARAAGATSAAGAAPVALQAIAFLLPLNIAALALLPERGIVTRAGALRLGLIVAQAGAVLALLGAGPEAGAVFTQALVPGELTAWTGIPQPGLVAFAIGGVALGVRLLLKPHPIERGLLWTLAAALVALHAAAAGASPTVYLAAGGLILAAAIVEASHAMAYRDALTGLPTRRALNEALSRLEGRYTVAMVDVDHFKQFNDRYGHDVGDQALRMVASHLARVRGGGKAYRYGGEEFSILFPGATLAEALPHLEETRGEIERAGFTVRSPDRPRKKPAKETARKPAKKGRTGKAAGAGSRTVPLTVSIGAAERGKDDADPDLVLKAADRALYRAKEAGRNKVMK